MSTQFDSGQPLDLEPAKPSSRAFIWVLSLLFLFFCATAAGVVYIGIEMLSGVGGDVAESGIPEELPEELQSETVDAYSDANRSLDPEFVAFQSQLSGALQANADGDPEPFKKMLDVDAMYSRVIRTSHLASLSFTERFGLKDALRFTDLPEHWVNPAIVAVYPSQDGSYARLYSLLDLEDEEPLEVRWYLRLGDDGWKVIDWQQIDFAVTESLDWAVWWKFRDTEPMTLYEKGTNETLELAGIDEASEFEQLAVKLMNYRVPKDLRGEYLIPLGYSIITNGRPELALKCFGKVRDPALNPGVYYGRAWAYSNQGNAVGSLEQLVLYGEHVGEPPSLLRLKARNLDRLERHAEAAECHAKLLEWGHPDTNSLTYAARWLPSDQKERIRGLIMMSEDPARAAQSVASGLAWSTDAARIFDICESVLAESEANEHRVAFVRGIKHRASIEYEEAARCFDEAYSLAEDVDDQMNYITWHVDMMHELGLTLDAYLNADNPAMVFEYLDSAELDGDLSFGKGEFDEIVRAHHEKLPQHLAGLLRYVDVLGRQGQYQEAEKILLERLAQASENEREDIELALVDLLVHAGRWLDAYRVNPATRLMRVAARAISQGKYDELQEILDIHDQDFPGAHMVDFYRVHRNLRLGLVEEARESWQRGVKKFKSKPETGDAYSWDPFERLQLSTFVHGGYESATDPKAVFDTVMNYYETNGMHAEASELFDLHSRRHPTDPNVIYWQLIEKKRNGWDKELIDLFQMDPFEMTSGLVKPRRSKVIDMLVGALIRSGEVDRAYPLAVRLKAEFDSEKPFVLCEIARNNVEAVRQLFLNSDTATPSFFLSDYDIWKGVNTVEMAAIRSEFPVGIPSMSFRILLESEVVEWTRDQIQKLAGPVLGADVRVTPITGLLGDPLAFRVENSEFQFMIRTAERAELVESYGQPPERSFEIIDNHRQSLWVVMLDRDDYARRKQDKLDELAAALVTPTCLGIYDDRNSAVVDNTPSSLRAFASSMTDDSFRAGYIQRSHYAYTEPDDRSRASKFKKSLLELHELINDAQEASEIEIEIQLGPTEISELLELTDVRIPDDAGDGNYVGKLKQDSRYYRELKAGDLIEAYTFEVTGWRSKGRSERR